MHPAKANVYLLEYLIKRYTSLGGIILDPMAGTGSTVVLAGLFGRRGIAIDIENKFVEWAKRNITRLKAVKPNVYVEAVQGDSRRLTELLAERVDVALFSPPFASEQFVSNERDRTEYFKKAGDGKGIGHSRHIRKELYQQSENIGNLPYRVDSVITSPPFAETESKKRLPNLPTSKGGQTEYVSQEEGISRLPYRVDSIIFSPPFKTEMTGAGIRKRTLEGKRRPHDVRIGCGFLDFRTEGNIDKLPYVDSIITSPPSADSVSAKGDPARRAERMIQAGLDPRTIVGGKARCGQLDWRYGEDKRNIGNLEGETYLEAMGKVYSECFKALKSNGLMILIVKPFIRKARVVDLPWHTWLLCKRVGFILREVLAVRLPQFSFWRNLYRQKNPSATAIKHEYVLIMQKP